jgi:hypothetical protein
MEWKKACRTDTPMCVEVSIGTNMTFVRDSKLGNASPVLGFTHDEWAAFVAGVRDGEFDVPTLASV